MNYGRLLFAALWRVAPLVLVGIALTSMVTLGLTLTP